MTYHMKIERHEDYIPFAEMKMPAETHEVRHDRRNVQVRFLHESNAKDYMRRYKQGRYMLDSKDQTSVTMRTITRQGTLL